ncbi:MAG: tRNA dihydrouridine synthase DusB [Candidatus Margulisbacteria bacterium]|nr:tRNA dihydrouridine synthase DusB [Candidatus Margulisiibacteriota bacterium]
MSRSVKIGSYKLPTNILLAPLSGVSDLAFRLISREHGARFAFYEMIDANALVNHSRTNELLLATTPKDKPLAAQLVGGNDEVMLKAAQMLLKLVKVPFLDINAACPVKKMIQKYSGANLLRQPDMLSRIITRLSAELPLPITVKLRIGYHKTDIKEFAQLAKRCEKSGASALFIHGRTKAQLYAGDVDYQAIKAAKEAVGIPVFGSGNVMTPELAKRMLDDTGCDGVMVARGAFGFPWIFEQIDDYLKTGHYRVIPLAERLKVLKRHLAYTDKYKKIRPGAKLGWMRKEAIWYLKGFPGAAELRGKVGATQSYQELLELIEDVGQNCNTADNS